MKEGGNFAHVCNFSTMKNEQFNILLRTVVLYYPISDVSGKLFLYQGAPIRVVKLIGDGRVAESGNVSVSHIDIEQGGFSPKI